MVPVVLRFRQARAQRRETVGSEELDNPEPPGSGVTRTWYRESPRSHFPPVDTLFQTLGNG